MTVTVMPADLVKRAVEACAWRERVGRGMVRLMGGRRMSGEMGEQGVWAAWRVQKLLEEDAFMTIMCSQVFERRGRSMDVPSKARNSLLTFP